RSATGKGSHPVAVPSEHPVPNTDRARKGRFLAIGDGARDGALARRPPSCIPLPATIGWRRRHHWKPGATRSRGHEGPPEYCRPIRDRQRIGSPLPSLCGRLAILGQAKGPMRREGMTMQFGLFGSAAARRGSPEFDSAEGFRDFIDYNVEAEAL